MLLLVKVQYGQGCEVFEWAHAPAAALVGLGSVAPDTSVVLI